MIIITTSPNISEFERKVAEYVGAKYAVAVSNGTAALHTACYAAGIEDKITSKTNAIISVDFTGKAVDADKILEIAKIYNLIVIEDTAHALGSEYK